MNPNPLLPLLTLTLIALPGFARGDCKGSGDPNAGLGASFKALAPLPVFDTSNRSCNRVPTSGPNVPFPDPRNPKIDKAVAEVTKWVRGFHVVADGSKRIGDAEDNPLKFGVYRGGELSEEGLASLKKNLGIKTIINLEDDFDTTISDLFVRTKGKKLKINEAAALAGKLGIAYAPFHMWADFCEPADKMLNRIIEIFKEPKNYPIYVHCILGEDRTGLAVALYRTTIEGMPASLAYEEMCQHGFKPNLLLGYQCWFKRHTGIRVPRRCFLAEGCKHHSLSGY